MLDEAVGGGGNLTVSPAVPARDGACVGTTWESAMAEFDLPALRPTQPLTGVRRIEREQQRQAERRQPEPDKAVEDEESEPHVDTYV